MGNTSVKNLSFLLLLELGVDNYRFATVDLTKVNGVFQGYFFDFSSSVSVILMLMFMGHFQSSPEFAWPTVPERPSN